MFQEGIDLCKRNVLDYLLEAKMLAGKGFVHHAYVSVQLAIEETGKALWLKEKLQSNPLDPVDVPNVIFGKNSGQSHKLKFEKAASKLNRDLMWVCLGTFDPKVFNAQVLNVGKEASHETHLLNAYVNFDEKKQQWYLGCDIDENKLIALVQNVEQVVSAL